MPTSIPGMPLLDAAHRVVRLRHVAAVGGGVPIQCTPGMPMTGLPQLACLRPACHTTAQQGPGSFDGALCEEICEHVKSAMSEHRFAAMLVTEGVLLELLEHPAGDSLVGGSTAR